MQWGTNHLGHFLLTHKLLPALQVQLAPLLLLQQLPPLLMMLLPLRHCFCSSCVTLLQQGQPSRVVNVSSMAHLRSVIYMG